DRTSRQQLARLFLGEIVTPGAEQRDRDAPADSEKLDAVDGDARAVKDVSLWPITARLDQFLGGFVVSTDQNGWPVDGAQHVDALTEISPHVAEVAGPDHDIHTAGALDQLAGRGSINVQITEE